MKAARDSGDDFCYPERKDNILGRRVERLELGEEHLKDPIVALEEALKSVENQCQGRLLALDTSWKRAQAWRQRCGTNFLCEGVWSNSDPWDSVRVCAQPPRIGMSQRSVDRTVSSSFSF